MANALGILALARAARGTSFHMLAARFGGDAVASRDAASMAVLYHITHCSPWTSYYPIPTLFSCPVLSRGRRMLAVGGRRGLYSLLVLAPQVTFGG